MTPLAVVAHTAPGRTRFRISTRRRDVAYFARLADALEAAPDVHRVEVNPVTGSVLIWHGGTADALGAFAAANDLFESSAGPERVADILRQQGRFLDQQIRWLSGRRLDFDSLLLLALLSLGLVQLARGQIIGPALTMFWYASTLAMPGKGVSDDQ